MKVDSGKRASTSSARGRGTYTSRACNFCRLRKVKCNGVKPICETCGLSGHECTWGTENAKRPSTKQYVESLKKRAEALEAYAALLESKLEQCRREHGGLKDDVGPSYLQSRPGGGSQEDYDVDSESDSDDDIAQQLCMPTENLALEDRDLLLHGPTAIFRYIPKPLNPSRFPEIAKNSNECYVLLVDGVDDTYYNPDFDWSRHLPSVVPLDRREHDKLLDLLFKFFTCWCMRIVPALFLRDMYTALSVPSSQTPPKTAHYSPMLHNALVALATAFSDDPRIRDHKSRQYFANAAKNYIEAECQKPNICVVHALSIIGSYHSSKGDQTLGYMYFGMSARMSQALGLSIDCSAWVTSGLISADDMLDRNWAHWTTFSQDVCWSLYVGRDFSVPAPSDRKNIPVPFVDSDFDQMPWHYPQSKLSPQPNFLSKIFSGSCELLIIARRIMDVVNGLNVPGTRPEVYHELISRIDLQLNAWKERLSPEVDITLATRLTATPHRIMMHLTYWWLFMLLHRPFYRRSRVAHGLSSKDIDHVKLCNRAAENVMDLLATWRSLYSLRYVPITLVQVVFSAGTIFLLSAVQATSGLRVAQVSLSHSLSQAELCIKYLLESGKSWQCATNIAGILRGLLQEQLRDRLDQKGKSVPEKSFGHRSSPRPSTTKSHTPLPVRPKATDSPQTSGTTENLLHGVLPSDSSTFHYPSWSPGDASDLNFVPDSFRIGDSLFSGMEFGMPGGETLSDQPFISFGMEEFGGTSDEDYLQQQGIQPQLELNDADMAALQQFLNQHAV